MAGGGGAWKVAYADFVTAMMAFFLVMWLVGQGQDVKQAIAGYFQDPWGTSSENAAPASLLPSETQGEFLRQDLRQSPRRGGGKEENLDPQSKSRWAEKRKVHFLQDDNRTTPAVIVSFDESSAELSEQEQSRLDRLVPSLIGKRNKIEVRGHSTRRPLPVGSPYADLWQLCYARCQTIMDYFVEHGIEPERLRLSQSAAFDPITRRLEATWQKENSRVEVFMLSEMAEEPPGTRRSKKLKPADRPATSPVRRAPAKPPKQPDAGQELDEPLVDRDLHIDEGSASRVDPDKGGHAAEPESPTEAPAAAAGH